MSVGAMPASVIASAQAATISASASCSSLPNRVWPQPTMHWVMAPPPLQGPAVWREAKGGATASAGDRAHGDALDLAQTQQLELDRPPDRFAVERLPQRIDARHRLAVEREHEVAHLDAGAGGRAAGGDLEYPD